MSMPKFIDDGENFPAEVKRVLKNVLPIVQGNASDDPLTNNWLEGMFQYLEWWRYRFSDSCRKEETFGLSRENAERVYAALDEAFKKFSRTRPGIQAISKEVFIEQAQETLSRLYHAREIEKLKSAFIFSIAKYGEVDVEVYVTWKNGVIETRVFEAFVHACIDELAPVEVRGLIYE